MRRGVAIPLTCMAAVALASGSAQAKPKRAAHCTRKSHVHRTRRCRPRHRPAAHVPVAPSVTGPAPAQGAPSAPAPAPTGEPGSGATPPSVPHVQVSAVEYHYTLSRSSVPAGKVIFEFVDDGQDEHNLNVGSQEGELALSFPTAQPKAVSDQSVVLKAGIYTLFCSLPEHEAKGMKATLTVQ